MLCYSHVFVFTVNDHGPGGHICETEGLQLRVVVHLVYLDGFNIGLVTGIGRVVKGSIIGKEHNLS